MKIFNKLNLNKNIKGLYLKQQDITELGKKNRISDEIIVGVLSNHLNYYPTVPNISYFWSFGSLAGMALVLQIITGVILTMYYGANTACAFDSVEHIMRDVNYGYLLRYAHANGASMFFIMVYVHIFRGIYYGSYRYPREKLWFTGVVLYILMMATAFLGYVLPWGQMSLWGATVITNFFSAIPLVGEDIVCWIWGGFSVASPTLNRFFSIHYLLPFILAAVALWHLIYLHEEGSNNPLGVESNCDKVSFFPYFYVKDLFSFIVFITFMSLFVFYSPNSLGHPDNYIEADALVTPPHIVPEWYFLPFYAILRSVPDKGLGIILMGLAIIAIMLLPLLNPSKFRTSTFGPIYKCAFWFLFVDFLLLGWLGQKEIETPYIQIGQVCTILYFTFFFVLTPFIGRLEHHTALYGFDLVEMKTDKEKHRRKPFTDLGLNRRLSRSGLGAFLAVREMPLPKAVKEN